MAAIASSSTTLQLSDGCQPDIVHLWKSEGKTLANFTKIGIFRRSLGLWGGALCLWLRHGPRFVVRGARQQYIQLEFLLLPQGALGELALMRFQSVTYN